jgi:23S rRNA pseudouridine2605 synthase
MKSEKKRNPPSRANNTSAHAGAKPRRINRILSLAGVTSRRKADDLIKAGRVTLEGHVVKELGTRAVWGEDSIKVDGKEISKPSARIYLMLNKPFAYISALSDPAGRPLVTDLITDIEERVYPVGRLDFDSLGLLLLTNDGEWAYRLTHPRYHVPRTYKLTVEGRISAETLNSLANGVRLEDGFSGPAKVALLRQEEGKSVIRMTITVGKSRLVRRMLEAVGHKVIQLTRIGFGGLELGGLKVGEYRRLETHEVESMKKMVGMH